MCGLVGLVRLDGAPVVPGGPDERFLRAACRRLRFRGPDDERVLLHGNVGLGFRRLAVVDLQSGAQPFVSPDGALALAANGEIYNQAELRAGLRESYRFASRSDCEVLLPLYAERGRDFLAATNGMFALALHDRARGRLLLARDRLGEKPLYWFRGERLLLFASELKALWCHPAVPRALDWRVALDVHDSLMLAPPGKALPALFPGVEPLPAGSYLELDLRTGAHHTGSFWRPEEAARAGAAASPGETAPAAAEAACARYRELLADSVRLRRMADVECGLFLSGGIDSVALAALWRADGGPALHTFTVLGQSTLGNGDAGHAHAAARALGLPNHQILFDFRTLSLSPEDWCALLWMCETPLCGAEVLYKYLLHAAARALRPDLKVILLGVGADEFNGGYTVARAPDGTGWDGFARAQGLHGLARRLRRAGLRPEALLTGAGCLVTARGLARLDGGPPPASAWAAYREAHLRSLQVYNLWHEDRTAAAHGIENRAPFLDHRLVELAWAVPPAAQAELFWDKTILRRALASLVPDELRLRAKVPFFQGPDLRYTRRLLCGLLTAQDGALIERALAAADGALDADALTGAVRALRGDPEHHGVEELLLLVNLALLEGMARDDATDFVRIDPEPLPVRERPIPDWEAAAPALGVELVARAPVTLASRLRFAPGVALLAAAAGAPGAHTPGAHYLTAAGQLAFELEPELRDWVRLLRALDGTRTLGELLAALELPEAAIRKHLDEALEHGVLEGV